MWSRNGEGAVARAHRQPPERVLRALVQRNPFLEPGGLQVVDDVLRLVPKILFETEHNRRVLQLGDASNRSNVLGHQLVRFAHV